MPTRQASICCQASVSSGSECWSKHSARKRPLKRSALSFRSGLPGPLTSSATRRRSAETSCALPVNVGTLSWRSRVDFPYRGHGCANTRATRRQDTDELTSMTRQARVKVWMALGCGLSTRRPACPARRRWPPPRVHLGGTGGARGDRATRFRAKRRKAVAWSDRAGPPLSEYPTCEWPRSARAAGLLAADSGPATAPRPGVSGRPRARSIADCAAR